MHNDKLKNLPKRKINRLQTYDYSSMGVYFITICTKDKKHILGHITKGNNHIKLSHIGQIVDDEIKKICTIYNNVTIANYCIMPNHIHLLISVMMDENRDEPNHMEGPPSANVPENTTPTISRIIKQFKGTISKHLNKKIWQKSFHDHIVRNENDFQTIWQYIDENPLKWENDCYFV